MGWLKPGKNEDDWLKNDKEQKEDKPRKAVAMGKDSYATDGDYHGDLDW